MTESSLNAWPDDHDAIAGDRPRVQAFVDTHRVAERALAAGLAELAHVSRLMGLGALTASIVHELTQPLSGIFVNACSCLQLLARDPPDVDGARETARLTVRDSKRASAVVRHLRSLFTSRDVSMTCVDLNAITTQIMALLPGELRRHRIVLRIELTRDLPAVTGDPVLLQQVVLNLVQNAIDAMTGVEGRPRELVVATATDGPDRVRLSVGDAGTGLDAARLDALFEPFALAKGDGMGIGLAISRAILERHRGTLRAEPNDSQGTTFTFSIPRTRSPGTAVPHDGIRATSEARVQ